MKDNRPLTIFCDIDGTLVEHAHPCDAQKPKHKMKPLPGTIDKIEEWDRKGYYIILVTGRKESMRHVTKKQLEEVGIIYDQLIMGISGGKRFLINDNKPFNSERTAIGITVKRNKGIADIEV